MTAFSTFYECIKFKRKSKRNQAKNNVTTQVDRYKKGKTAMRNLRGKSIGDIEQEIKDKDIEFVRFEQSDMNGISRSKTVPLGSFMEYMEDGLNFYGGLLGLDIQSMVPAGTGYAEEIAFADQRVRPDLSTFTALPWIPNTAKITVDPYWYDGTPAMASPRLQLKRLIEEFDKLGYICRLGYEFEFYVLDARTKKPVYSGRPIFVTLKNNWDMDFTYDLMRKMEQAGIRIITQNSEHGPGQQEINLFYMDGIESADVAFTFRHGIKEIALQHDYIATNMTKPFIDSSGSGSHFHISLIDKKTGKNAFFDPEADDQLSELCTNFIGGLLKHARANTIFMAPTINCYKRYRINSFAPDSATWGLENRTVGIRIKGVRGEATHIENRLACAASNPYLVAASCLAAGLTGIRNGTKVPEPIQGVAYERKDVERLPRSLEESIEEFTKDKELRDVFGEEFCKLVIALKSFEVETAKSIFKDYGSQAFNDRVDPWEHDYYMELL
jgi:glutamine synthetase